MFYNWKAEGFIGLFGIVAWRIINIIIGFSGVIFQTYKKMKYLSD